MLFRRFAVFSAVITAVLTLSPHVSDAQVAPEIIWSSLIDRQSDMAIDIRQKRHGALVVAARPQELRITVPI